MAFSISKVGSISGAGNYLNGACGVVVYGNYAYVVSNTSDAVVVIDISTPAAPSRSGQITGGANYLTFVRGIAHVVDGNYIYVVSKDDDSFVIIDISTPAAPVKVGQLLGAGNYLDQANSVAVQGNYAYVTGNVSKALVVIDISTKASPTRVGQITGAGNYLDSPRGIAVSGSYAYVVCDTQNSLAIFDVSTPSSPSFVGEIHTAAGNYLGAARDVVVDGDYAYVASYGYNGMAIIDISNKAVPAYKGQLTGGMNGAIGIHYAYDYAFVASLTSDSIVVVDVSNKSLPSVAGSVSGAGNLLDGAQGVHFEDWYVYVAASISDALVVCEIVPTAPEAPTAITCTPTGIKNTISWTNAVRATDANLYWMKYELFPDTFTSLDFWDDYKDVGTETLQAAGGKLQFSNSVGTGCHVVNKKTIPSGDFDIEIALSTYTPDDNNNGHKAILRTLDVYPFASVDGAEVYYYVSGGGATHNIVSNIWINSVLSNSSAVIAGQPTKLRITRVGTVVSTYYWVASWVLVDTQDFAVRASNLDTITLDTLQTSGHGGLTEFDNFDYYVDVKTLGTKVASVSSPYDHTSLDDGLNYIYVVTGENPGGEGTASDIVYGATYADPPTGISLLSSTEKITISFTADTEADQTHIYWSNSPGVTPGTGTKIADATSPYEHSSLDYTKDYYYILVSETIAMGEGTPSAEYSETPGSPTCLLEGSFRVVPENRRVFIRWDDIDSGGADYYTIYWSNDIAGPYTGIDVVSGPYTHDDLTNGLVYFYFMTFTIGGVESCPTSIKKAELPLDTKYKRQMLSLLPKGFIWGG